MAWAGSKVLVRAATRSQYSIMKPMPLAARPPIASMRGAAALPDDVARALQRCASVRDVEPLTILVRQHDRVHELVVLLHGRVTTLVEFTGAGNLAVETSQDVGRIFGWSGLRAPYRAAATARADSVCRIMTFPLDEVRALIADRPAWAAAIYGLLAGALADRSRDLEAQWAHIRMGVDEA